MRIGEVEIMSRFTPASASVENIFAATPGCVFMPAPTSETLAIDSSMENVRAPSSLDGVGHRAPRADQVVLGHREGDVGGALLGDVLDDHVDVDVVLGHAREDPCRHAGVVGHVAQA